MEARRSPPRPHRFLLLLQNLDRQVARVGIGTAAGGNVQRDAGVGECIAIGGSRGYFVRAARAIGCTACCHLTRVVTFVGRTKTFRFAERTEGRDVWW